jgi:hypothetical protein
MDVSPVRQPAGGLAPREKAAASILETVLYAKDLVLLERQALHPPGRCRSPLGKLTLVKLPKDLPRVGEAADDAQQSVRLLGGCHVRGERP